MPARVMNRSNAFESNRCRETLQDIQNTNKAWGAILPTFTTTTTSRKQRTGPITSTKDQATDSHTTKKMKRGRRKSVSFCQAVRVKKVLHINNYTPAEHEATWYTDLELAAMRQEMHQAIKMMEMFRIRRGCHQQEDHLDFTSRGLEARTQEGSQERMKNKLVARKILLQAQDLIRRSQERGGVCDPEYLSFIYIGVSQHCRVAAQEIGRNDEYVAAQQLLK